MAERKHLELFWLSFALCLWSSYGHLCLITPRQRGDMDIAQSGSHTCFRHGAECGGEPAQLPPKTVLEGGRPVFIKWQQNYNHYNFGFPGYMDLAIADNSSRSNENRHGHAEFPALSPFVTLAVVPDPNVYDQDHQRNYTAVVTLPNRDCEHCVIRARYAAHKPGETTFYQCADVKIKATGHAHLARKRGELQLLDYSSVSSERNPDASRAGEERLRKALALTSTSANREQTVAPFSQISSAPNPALRGLSSSLDDPLSASYFAIDTATGVKYEVSKLSFRVDSIFDPSRLLNGTVYHGNAKFVSDGVFSLNSDRGVTMMSLNSGGKREAFPDSIVEINTETGALENQYRIKSLNKTTFTSAFSAVFTDTDNSLLTFSLDPAAQQGKFNFVIGRLLSSGVWQIVLRSNQSEDLYVNFQWAEYDVNTKTLYALLGNENDADGLSARIYKFSLPQGYRGAKMTFVELDVSEFTFMSFPSTRKTLVNHLWAISPGLHSAMYPCYYLVDVNTDVGSVGKVAQLTPPGIFERYYGGAVAASGPGETNHLLRQVLRVADTQADVIMTVDTLRARASFSQMTNLRHIHNLVYA